MNLNFQKSKTLLKKSNDFLKKQWYGLKVLYWLVISLFVVSTLAYLMFKPKKNVRKGLKKPKIK